MTYFSSTLVHRNFFLCPSIKYHAAFNKCTHLTCKRLQKLCNFVVILCRHVDFFSVSHKRNGHLHRQIIDRIFLFDFISFIRLKFILNVLLFDKPTSFYLFSLLFANFYQQIFYFIEVKNSHKVFFIQFFLKQRKRFDMCV